MEETLWAQVNIIYRAQDRQGREHEALAHLVPALAAADASGLLSRWFFIRKRHWRIRYLPEEGAADQALAHLTAGVQWAHGSYEPEVHAFGGPPGMDAAHTLWHADSRSTLAHLADGGGDRRERSLVLCTAMMRAADLDLYEQGDVWARAAEHRPIHRANLPDRRTWAAFTADVRRLLTGEANPDGAFADWLTAFRATGTTLIGLSHDGTLTRGVRAVIAHHVLFHWNRLGLTAQSQGMIALAAKEAVFGS
ncbi:hypothetical protein Acor_51040 [Acrocarpospora corrugata]|uniref:Thiopeptide-type bacteriocin biosynthesis domain-containing protein n=1 Tax=Acrocarpospora corrugata TaxID=35763 RepID=A0A5M3W961_9ACTN|nr:thiopeptide-type bacteriocin biosynthesis protein [Acrocarpospora corrugata]GES03038.1 hypothetical protein Acor_51040 [Acrocarpospora corrugata]